MARRSKRPDPSATEPVHRMLDARSERPEVLSSRLASDEAEAVRLAAARLALNPSSFVRAACLSTCARLGVASPDAGRFEQGAVDLVGDILEAVAPRAEDRRRVLDTLKARLLP